MKYEYGKITMLQASLVKHGISNDIIEQILSGGESITTKTSSAQKAAWLKEAMLRLAKLVPGDKIQPVREDCACCKGGLRNKLSKAIYKNYATDTERIQAADQTRFVFGHSVKQLSEGVYEVCYFGEAEHYRCPCLPRMEGVMPISYCMCCGGHVKHHLQNALGKKLKVKVIKTALCSEGKQPCTFELREE